jgi:hypothetical protein
MSPAEGTDAEDLVSDAILDRTVPAAGLALAFEKALNVWMADKPVIAGIIDRLPDFYRFTS